MKNWLDEIAEQAHQKRNGRDVVIWGYYGAAFELKKVLLDKYDIKTAFHVDGNKSLIDDIYVFPPDVLDKNSQKYFVLIPLSYHQSIKDSMILWGYDDNDYYYFNDCILVHDDKTYLDRHGNKISYPPRNVKFTFTGYDNVITFKQPMGHFSSLNFTVGSNNHIDIGSTNISGSEIIMGDENRVIIGDQCEIRNSRLVFWNENKFVLKEQSIIQNVYFNLSDKSKVDIGYGSFYEGNSKLINGNLHIGDGCEIASDFTIYPNSQVSIRNKCIIGARSDTHFAFRQNNIMLTTENARIDIEDDCLFSINVKIISGDGHSIFDTVTGENVNRNRNSVKIGRHSWVGANVILLANSEIGEECIVGGGSVVKGKYPDNCIIAGNPSRVIKENRTWDSDWTREHL